MVFSDDDEKITDELDDLIDNIEQPQEDVSFYRKLDPLNIDHYPKFPNQTRNGPDAIFEDDTPYYEKEDMRPELYTLEDFVNMLALKNLSINLRPSKILKIVKINFFDAIIYGVMFYKSNREIIDKKK